MARTARLAGAALAALTFTLALATAAHADPGGLDPAFGTGGIVRTPGPVLDVVGTTVQPDGKLLVVGDDGVGTQPTDRHWTIRRYHPDGSLDAAFGTGGLVTLFGGAGNNIAWGVKVDAAGRIVVCGGALANGQNSGVVARFLSNGALDTSFGVSGTRAMVIPNGLASLTSSLALQADGKIVLSGWVILKINKKSSQRALLLARCTDSGGMDATFGNAGIALYDPNPTADDLATVDSLGIQSTGKIVVGGRLNGSTGSQQWAVVRFLANGARDTSFPVVTEAGRGLNRLEVDPSDRIVVLGNGANGGNTSDVAVVRYLSGGARDTSFGAGGLAWLGLTTAATAGSVAFQADGKLVIAVTRTSPQPSAAQAVRLLEDGALDVSYGAGGFGQPLAFPPSATNVFCVEIAPGGGALLAGFYQVSPGVRDALVAQYLP